MFYWFSPFTLSPDFQQEIAKAGGLLWDSLRDITDKSKLLLIYQPPHELLDQYEAMAEGYEKIRKLSNLGNVQNLHRLICYFSSADTTHDPDHFAEAACDISLPEPEPLEALVTLALLRELPAILDAYIDLEMRAELLHASPDTAYFQRLRQATVAKNVISSFISLSDPSSIIQAREEAELNMLELHSIQEELELVHQVERDNLERIKLADFEIARLSNDLESLSRELEATRAESNGYLLANESLDSTIALLSSENTNLKEELFNGQQVLSQASQNIRVYKEKLQIIFEDLTCRDRDLASARLQLQNVQEQLQALRLADRSKLDRLQSVDLELEKLRDEVESLNHQLINERKEFGLISLNNHNLETTIALLRRDNEHLTVELNNHQHHLAQSLQEVCKYQNNLHNISQELASRDRVLVSVREDADLNLLQLHQMQEELQQVFQDCQAQRLLIEAQKDQLERAAKLLQGFGAQKRVSIIPNQTSIQVLALLEGYRHSLKRAERLLGGF